MQLVIAIRYIIMAFSLSLITDLSSGYLSCKCCLHFKFSPIICRLLCTRGNHYAKICIEHFDLHISSPRIVCSESCAFRMGSVFLSVLGLFQYNFRQFRVVVELVILFRQQYLKHARIVTVEQENCLILIPCRFFHYFIISTIINEITHYTVLVLVVSRFNVENSKQISFSKRIFFGTRM